MNFLSIASRLPLLGGWLRTLPPARVALLEQLRYAVVGGGVTAAQAAAYWLLATRADWHVQAANFCGYLVAVTLGYLLHGRVTFRDHAAPVDASGHAVRAVRFALASLVSLALNAFWVWLTVTALHTPTWAPIPLMLVATPLLVFAINRTWVFR